MAIHILDILVLVVYFGITLGVGLYFSKKNTDTEEYFLGGRSFPGRALGLGGNQHEFRDLYCLSRRRI